MKIPLILNGERAGEVRAEEDGLYIRFTASAERAAPLTRLWLHGGGETRYLGLMRPEGSRLVFERRISRRGLGALAEGAEYASNSGEPEREEEPPGAAGAESAADAPEDYGGLLWYRTAGGSLTAFDGARTLTAIPAKLRQKPPGVDLRLIEGKEYIVFVYNEARER